MNSIKINELKAPPGKQVLWHLETHGGNKFVVKAQTAYEAAANCGLKLSDCKANIVWMDSDPI